MLKQGINACSNKISKKFYKPPHLVIHGDLSKITKKNFPTPKDDELGCS